jgi:hypothetical protein
MNYEDSKKIMEKVNKNSNIWRPRTLVDRAKKVLKQVYITRHFCKQFDSDTGSGIFSIIVKNYLE